MALGLDSAYPIDLLEDPSEAIDGYIDVMDFPSGGKYRKGSDVLDHLIQLEKVEAPTPGKQFLDGFLMAHVSPDGGPHDWQAPGHGGIRVPGGEINPHGQRGSGTWGDGTARDNPLFHQGGKRTFADGTPITSKNYEAFKINPNVAPILQ